jgi:hypothetical protein
MVDPCPSFSVFPCLRGESDVSELSQLCEEMNKLLESYSQAILTTEFCL